MAERRKRQRRTESLKLSYPRPDSNGVYVTGNRRRVIDRRVQDPARVSRPFENRCRLRFQGEVKETSSGTAAPVLLGRASGCDIKVSSCEISRRHARIEYVGAGFILIDQSTNGTYVRFDDGGQIHVIKDRIDIRGSGVISLGKPVLKRAPNLIYFWCD